MDPQSPILVRLFKQEAELEVWKQDKTGRFALLTTYPICRWSGDLGPKVKEGDRQAPEGFYNITPAQMNPESQFYLAFNMGYPNAYDRSLGRTGAHLMVHGDCSSRGCYAMTDEQMSEIYALGRESFFGGQQSFQVQAYPFRMTAQNMAKHRNNPNMPFWKMLKQGNDHFEVTQLEPKVDVCEQRYVFNAEKDPNSTSTRPLNFSPTGKCPAYDVPGRRRAGRGRKAAQGRVRDRRADHPRHAERGAAQGHRRRHASAVRGEDPERQHRPLGNQELYTRLLCARAAGAAERQPAGLAGGDRAIAAAPNNGGGDYVSPSAPASPAAAAAAPRSEPAKQPAAVRRCALPRRRRRRIPKASSPAW